MTRSKQHALWRPLLIALAASLLVLGTAHAADKSNFLLVIADDLTWSDLENDPYETKDFAADKKFAAIKTRLTRELDAWIAQQGDKGMATEQAAKSRQDDGIAGAKKKAAEAKKEDH